MMGRGYERIRRGKNLIFFSLFLSFVWRKHIIITMRFSISGAGVGWVKITRPMVYWNRKYQAMLRTFFRIGHVLNWNWKKKMSTIV